MSIDTIDSSIFKDYSELTPIGGGGFSTVYSAIHIQTNRKVAIKHVKKEILGKDNNLRNFVREMEIMKKIDHPFIACIIDIIETSDSYFLVMELIENGTLLSKVNNEGFKSEGEKKMIYTQLASALYYLHIDAGIIHRDIKLENILFDKNWNIRLVDFGLSCNLEYHDKLFKTLCGSYPYAAPEIFLKNPYTTAVDIWSLGVCMYAVAVGRLPFFNTNTAKLIQMIIREEPTYPLCLDPLLVDLLKGMLEKNPSERFNITQVVNHKYFQDTNIMDYIELKCLNVTPNEKTGLDPEIGHEVASHGLSPKRAAIFGSMEATMYRILRKEKVSELICDISEFAQDNVIIKKGSAPSVIKIDEPILRMFNKTTTCKHAQIPLLDNRRPALKMRNSTIAKEKHRILHRTPMAHLPKLPGRGK